MSRCFCRRRCRTSWPRTVRFVLGLVRDDVDVAEITHGSERGQPPFNPMMMTACCCIPAAAAYSSHRTAEACRERVDFMSLAGLDAPDFRTISIPANGI